MKHLPPLSLVFSFRHSFSSLSLSLPTVQIGNIFHLQLNIVGGGRGVLRNRGGKREEEGGIKKCTFLELLQRRKKYHYTCKRALYGVELKLHFFFSSLFKEKKEIDSKT